MKSIPCTFTLACWVLCNATLAQHVIHRVQGLPADGFGAAVVGLGDVDLDGVPDFGVGAAARGGTGAVDVFSGRDGSLLRTLTAAGVSQLGAVLVPAGDVDRDGRPDLWVQAQSDVLCFAGANGALLWRHPALSGFSAAHDVDKDGHDDVLLYSETGGSTEGGWVEIRSGRTGAVLLTRSVSTPVMPVRVMAAAGVGDTDLDGVPDFVVSYRNSNGLEFIDLISGRTGLVLHTLRGEYMFARGRALGPAGDFDRDGSADYFVEANGFMGPPPLYCGVLDLVSGRGGLITSVFGLYRCTRFSSCPVWRPVQRALGVGDFDGDGATDIVALFNGHIRVLSATGRAAVIPATIAAPAGDIDRDGAEDLVVSYPGEGQVLVQRVPLLEIERHAGPGWLGRGATFGVRSVGDLDRDGYVDAAISALGYNSASGRIPTCSIVSGRDSGTLVEFTSGSMTRILAAGAGDVDGDGWQDLIVGKNGNSPPEHTAEIWSRGTRLIRTFLHADYTFGIGIAGEADWNGDGVDDAFVAAASFTEIRSGRDGTLIGTIPQGGASLQNVGDLDGDGEGEVSIGTSVYSSRTRGVLMNLPAQPVAAGDVDGDGRADLWIGLATSIDLVSGRTGTTVRRLPWPSGVAGGTVGAGADWNRDGVGDLIVAVALAPSLREAAVVISGVDGCELFSLAGETPGDGFGQTLTILDAPAAEAPRLIVSAPSGGDLLQGYAHFWRRIADPGGAAAFGAGCHGQLGVPSLFLGPGAPRVGGSYLLRSTGAHILTPSAFVLGGSDSRWSGVTLPLPLAPFGFAECVLFVSPDVVLLATTDFAGRASLPLQIPQDPSLIGARVFAQSVHRDSTANQGAGTVSHAMRVVIGR